MQGYISTNPIFRYTLSFNLSLLLCIKNSLLRHDLLKTPSPYLQVPSYHGEAAVILWRARRIRKRRVTYSFRSPHRCAYVSYIRRPPGKEKGCQAFPSKDL